MSFDVNARIARAHQTKRGLTLIELIVVLVILVGLGGLLVPVISNGLERTHLATCAQSFPEVAQMIGRRVTTGGDVGDGWDTGVFDATGNRVNGGAAGATISANQVAALNALGITTVNNHGDPSTADYNVTFAPFYVTETLTASTELIVLDAAQILALNLDAGGTYVWLGIGPGWEGMRDDAYETPVHFGDTDGLLPHQVYSRFGGIFQVADAGGDFERAEFKGCSYSLDGTAFETGENHIALHWQEVVAN
ncbi:MAG: prepilin-type N-terminal cleavage/methylation domain-containing protein [Planctomycetota bacterium]